jgi:small subunit ribosomal protein S6
MDHFIVRKEEPMRNYEFTVIFDANEEKTAKGLEFVTSQLAAAKANVAKQEDMGVRNLAYLIKKQDKGHYYYFELEAEPQSINAMAAEFLLQGEILKHLFVLK